ncbi:TIGR00296 family protein [Sulfolobales archaeon HS-7]|nr:TIGR00296 family protein [Sulfolobales archaeon HS-7]
MTESLLNLNKEQAKILIKIAKKSIESRFSKSDETKMLLDSINDPVLNSPGLAFVTINQKVGERLELRGCIGFVEAIAPLKEIVAKAAAEAAFGDPRFPPLKEWELNSIEIEITILSKPEKFNVYNRREVLNQITLGKHGLLIRKGITHSGLLLPQVPIEYSWDAETFLAQTCIKAGLMPYCWLDENTDIYRFEGVVIKEENDDVKIGL